MEWRRKTQPPRYRSCAKILRQVALHAFIIAAVLAEAAAQDPVAVAKRYDARIAHVESIGTLYDGKQEVGGGSGLLIGDTYILTNNHVVPEEANYKEFSVSIRLKSRKVDPLKISAIHRDTERDLALLELAVPQSAASGPRCPMPVLLNPEHAPMGTSIVILGFPADGPLAIADGLLSSQEGAGGRWQTNAPFNPGNSGGPAFDRNGVLLGILVSGITKIVIGGESRPINAINLFIPLQDIRKSPLFQKILMIPEPRRCWVDYLPAPVIVASTELRAPTEPLQRTFFVNVTKDDHPVLLKKHSRNYEQRFQAQPGFRITGCQWQGVSENHQSNVACSVDAVGASVLFSFRLTSGPAFDRWRGWLAGHLTLAQEPQK